MKENPVQQSDKDEWRDHVLQEIVDFLSKNKEEIHHRYLDQRRGQLPRDFPKLS